jgi:hypothetical protein
LKGTNVSDVNATLPETTVTASRIVDTPTAASPQQVPMFVERLLDVTFKLGTGTFGDGAADTVKMSGLRASAQIIKAGGTALGSMQLRLWGLTLAKMNQLSTLGMVVTQLRKNSVLLEAGDAKSGMSKVFEGTIQDGWADLQNQPDVAFHVFATTAMFDGIKPVAASSYRGATDVAQLMASLAKTMGLAFENSGVSGQILHDAYFPGTARDQAQAVAAHAGINLTIENGILAIWPKGQGRGQDVPLISPSTGMQGYPGYTSMGVVITSLFNPAVKYGSKVKVESSIKPACGEWVIYKLAYDLNSKLVGGHWLMRFEAAPPGWGPPIA